MRHNEPSKLAPTAESKLPSEVNVKSSAVRALALASSLSIGIFLIARANSGCSSETQGVAQPEAPLPVNASAAPSATDQPAVTAEEHFFQGSKAPGGMGLRPPAPAASSVQIEDEDFFSTSKSGRLVRPKQSAQPNANPAPQQNAQ